MMYGDVSATMRQFLGCRETLRRLNFQADDLFFVIAMSASHGGLSVFCELRDPKHGARFSVECGPVASEEDAEREYAEAGAAINSGTFSDEDLARIFNESDARKRAIELCFALQAKGFRLPVRLPAWALPN